MYASQAQSAGKKLIMKEWGACYFDTSSSSDCDAGGVLATAIRNENIEYFASNITAAGLPWLYWEVLPNADPHYDPDYEIGLVDDPSWDTLKAVAEAAAEAEAAFDLSDYVL